MPSRRVATLAAVLTLPLLLAACGSPSRATPSDLAQRRPERSANPTVFPAKSKSPSPAPSSPNATATPTGAPSISPSPGGTNEVAATADNKFAPATLTVKAGTAVTWTAPAGTFHTVTGGKDGQKDPASPLNGPIGFTTYSVTFDKPGNYPYYCEPHVSLGMVGEIVVT